MNIPSIHHLERLDLSEEPTHDAPTTEAELTHLFRRYLAVCNHAIDANEEHPILRPLLVLMGGLVDDHTFAIEIHDDDDDDDDAGRPPTAFTFRFKDGRLAYLERGRHPNALVTWKTDRAHLERVVTDPITYIEHPALLDWDWLKTRLGIG